MLKLRKLSVLLGLIFCAMFSSCVTTCLVNLDRNLDTEVEVYTSKLPTREYIEIKYIQVQGSVWHKKDKLLTILKENAKKEGAYAIVNVKFDFNKLLTSPIVSGTAVKYK